MPIDNNAPILPGEAAASIKLGEKIENVLRSASEHFIAENEGTADGVTRYRSAYVDLWIKAGLIWQIMVHDGYMGKVFGSIGLGSTLREVQELLGTVTIIDDNLMVKGIPGISFEPQTESLESPIQQIYVWKPDWVELRDHQES